MLRLRAFALAVVAACAFGVGACGGDPSYGDPVPASTPELTPPAGADALADESATTTDEDSTTTDTGTTGTAPSTGGTATGGTATGTPTQTTPQPGAGTGGAAGTTTQAPQDDTGGTSPGEFNQFCQDNPGACPGN